MQQLQAGRLNLSWLKDFYKAFGKPSFFTSFFDKLAGTDKLKNQIMEGLPEEEIRQSWQKDLKAYREKRKKYLLYRDYQ